MSVDVENTYINTEQKDVNNITAQPLYFYYSKTYRLCIRQNTSIKRNYLLNIIIKWYIHPPFYTEIH